MFVCIPGEKIVFNSHTKEERFQAMSFKVKELKVLVVCACVLWSHILKAVKVPMAVFHLTYFLSSVQVADTKGPLLVYQSVHPLDRKTDRQSFTHFESACFSKWHTCSVEHSCFVTFFMSYPCNNPWFQ